MEERENGKEGRRKLGWLLERNVIIILWQSKKAKTKQKSSSFICYPRVHYISKIIQQVVRFGLM